MILDTVFFKAIINLQEMAKPQNVSNKLIAVSILIYVVSCLTLEEVAVTQNTISVVFCLTPQAIGTLEEVAMTQNTINTISVVFCLNTHRP